MLVKRDTRGVTPLSRMAWTVLLPIKTLILGTDQQWSSACVREMLLVPFLLLDQLIDVHKYGIR